MMIRWFRRELLRVSERYPSFAIFKNHDPLPAAAESEPVISTLYDYCSRYRLRHGMHAVAFELSKKLPRAQMLAAVE